MSVDRLLTLYSMTSKHSQYQILARPLAEVLPSLILNTVSRHEQERLDYILKKLPSHNVTICDIGGNTGFFTLEFIDHGARSALMFEGNEEHSAFVEEAVAVLGWQDRVTVCPRYVTFGADLAAIDVDVCLLLNVLHHVGDDYGTPDLSIVSAREKALSALSRLSQCTRHLVFQLGFNWQGDRNQPLFEHGTKRELIDFVKAGTEECWTIQAIGIAEAAAGGIVYRDLDEHNIHRQDSLGEFLNRPLFVMQSRLKI